MTGRGQPEYLCLYMSIRLPAAGVLLAAVVALGPQAVAQSSDAVLAAFGRIRKDAMTTMAPEQREVLESRSARGVAAVQANRPWLALYDLQAVWEMEGAWAFVKHGGVSTAAEFEAKWKAVGEPAVVGIDTRPRPVFVEALAQSAEGKAPATYRASLPYAEDAGLQGGLYYLGESRAFVAFAAFCRGLQVEPAGARPPLRSIDAELSRLEAAVLDAYEKAPNAERQPFIVISVTLKQARYLENQQRFAGAWLQYLLALLRFAQTRAAGSSADLPARLAAARVTAPGVDHSIADFFVQFAEHQIAAGGDAAERTAAAIIEDVLPAYRALVKP